MTSAASAPGPVEDFLSGVIIVLVFFLFVVGLCYRLFCWITTPDEKTALRRERRREQLRRTVRRPARDVPIHEELDAPVHDTDPALNDEELS